jgi:hypothetical protein
MQLHGLSIPIAGLSVRPESFSTIAKLSQHEADRSETQKSAGAVVEILPILGKASAAVEPCKRAFDDPAFGQNNEALGLIRSFNNIDVQTGENFGQCGAEDRPFIGAVGEEFLEEWEQAEQRR